MSEFRTFLMKFTVSKTTTNVIVSDTITVEKGGPASLRKKHRTQNSETASKSERRKEKMTQIYNMSTNARIAFEQGERVYDQWTKADIIADIHAILAENCLLPPDNIDKLNQVTEKVLREYMLKKSSWHHVNNQPVWFYTVDSRLVCSLSRKDVCRMLNMVRARETGRNKPKLAIVKRSRWTEKNGHQFTKSNTAKAVVYNDCAYFENGKKADLRPGRCAVVKECGPIVKENRAVFEKILKHMRTSYNIAI